MIFENQYVFDDIAQIIGDLKRPHKKNKRKKKSGICFERYFHGR